MVNAQSGVAELLRPRSDGNSVRRQNSDSAQDFGSFGDTLKDQMQGNGQPDTKAPDAADTQAAKANSGPHSGSTKADKHGKKAAGDDGDDDRDNGDSVVALPGTATDPSRNAAAPTGTDAAAADEAIAAPELAMTGKKLPAGTVLDGNAADSGGDGDAAADGGKTLPRWFQSLGLTNADSSTSAATGDQTSTASAADGAANTDFSQGLLDAQSQLGGAGKDGGPSGKTQTDDILFRLVGQSAQSDTASAPTPTGPTLASTPTDAAAANTNQVQQLALPTQVQQQGWDHALAERVVWMAKQGVQEASIQLNPRELGPIEVHLSVDKGDANVTFVAHHGATRDALEAAMPRLRDMMRDSGLNLAQSDVSHHSFERQQQSAGFGGGRQNGSSPLAGDGSDGGVTGETLLSDRSGLGVVDYYA